jgi:hypothetical protein
MKRMFLRLSLLSLLLTGSTFANGPWISVSDGVAGRDVPVRISGLLERESLSLLLVRPDESKISLDASTDELGIASFFVHGLHVWQAGEYELLVRRGQSLQVISKQFIIVPGLVSAYRSIQSVDIPSLAADGERVARIRVQVKDAHGNLIAKAPIRAFSSRTEDSVVFPLQTNAQGEVTVKVSSKTPGVSSISVLAGETLLFERTELVFHLAKTGTVGMGASGIGKFLQTSLFEDPEENTAVAYFSIEDIGAEVVSGKNLTIRIGAKDKNGDVVPNYTGTIRFSSSDDRAVLPNDYTFITEDQGWHTFYLSVMLQTPGMQTVAVHDLDDFRISGERNVTVADGSGIVAVPNADPELSIDVPLNGATFNTSRIMISGTAKGVSAVRLTDGPIELIDLLPVDSSGTYVYQTPGLADGTHVFQATAVEDPTVVSNIVQIKIDRSPPQVMSAEISPEGNLLPGSEVTLKIGASDELSAVSCVVFGQQYDLTQVDSKNFSVTFRAPLAQGEYPLACTVSDLLGNKMTEPNAGVVVVAEKEQILVTLVPAGDVAPGAEVKINISTEKEMEKVQYSLLGVSQELTKQDAQHFSGSFTAPMELGEYAADFTGKDLFGNEIANKTPTTFIVSNTGNGLNIAPFPVSNVQTIPGEKKVTVLWSPAVDDNGIKNYRIKFGAVSTLLDGVNVTPDARTQWYVDNLIPCVEYFFQVTPIDTNGTEGPSSTVISGTPNCEEVKHLAPPKTGGSTSWWFAVFSVLAGLGVVILLRLRA